MARDEYPYRDSNEIADSVIGNAEFDSISEELFHLNQIDFERFVRVLFAKLEWKANLGQSDLRRKIIDKFWEWMDEKNPFPYSAFLQEKINCLFPRDFDRATNYLCESFTSIPEYWITKIVSGPVFRDKERVGMIMEAIGREKSDELPPYIQKVLVTDKCNYWLNPLLTSSIEEPKEFLIRGNDNGTKLKVAVAVSGQMRGYESAFNTWEVLLRNHEADFFVSTWLKNGVSGKPNHLSNNKSRFFWGDLDEESIRYIHDNENSPEIMRLVLPDDTVSESDILSVYGGDCVIDIQDEEELNFFNSNAEKMYYKIQRCDSLIENREKYDLIIRIRPDLVIIDNLAGQSRISDQDLLFSMKSANPSRKAIFSGYGFVNGYYGFGIDDKFAAGTPDLMKIYSGVYSNQANLAGHISLAEHLFSKSIDSIGLSNHIRFSFSENKLVRGEDLALLIKNQ